MEFGEETVRAGVVRCESFVMFDVFRFIIRVQFMCLCFSLVSFNEFDSALLF